MQLLTVSQIIVDYTLIQQENHVPCYLGASLANALVVE